MLIRTQSILGALAFLLLPAVLRTSASAQTCTTQSQMQPADRDALAAAARALADRIAQNDTAGLQTATVAEFAKDFTSMGALATETSQHLRGATLAVEQVYLLDATQLKSAATEPAQFFCSLNGTQSSVDFSIPGLTAGRYGFAIVDARGPSGAAPWRVPMLLRQEGGRWLLAGFYPRPTEAAGHDGVWYWREARRLSAAKELWSAWLFYEEATALLRPANFVDTTHLGKLEDEQRQATPPQLSSGVSSDVPLVLRSTEGEEFRITRLAPDNSLGRAKLDVVMHLDTTAAAPDAAALQRRADTAAKALLAAYPELKKEFGGILVALENGGKIVFTQERPIA